jgi:hypothetical protein
MRRVLLTAWLVVGLCSLLAAEAGANSTVLANTGASDQRWKDVAHTLYAESYRTGYAYDQARVVVDYESHANTLVGRLVAANLKPNFAYQIKLEAIPGSDCAERLGSVGRYWRDTWDGTAWTEAWNLNNKGYGSYPNPNDLAYLAERDTTDADSPTGLHYRFTIYLLLAYMITDENGNGTADLRMDSSYHVLWRADQRTRGASDGPIVPRTFTPSASSAAYDADGTEQTVGVFAEWERLPTGGLRLPNGDYDLNLVLTEESFHHGDEFDGWWTTVMKGRLAFASGLPPEFAEQPQSCLVHTGDAVQLSATLTESTGTTVSWRKDGVVLADESSLNLNLGQVDAAAAGTYVCMATNAFGETTSHAAVILLRDDLWTNEQHDQVVDAKNAEIADLHVQIDELFTPTEVDQAIAEARPDRDGDGFTDAQETDRGTDPDLYTILLKPGWNLISLARVPEDNTIDGIFGALCQHVVGKVWRWDRATMRYEAADRLESLRGHWLFWDGEETEIEIDLPEHPAQ